MKKFIFYWLNGNYETLEGTSANNALNKAGYGFGALKALDFHEESENPNYVWKNNKWVTINSQTDLTIVDKNKKA